MTEEASKSDEPTHEAYGILTTLRDREDMPEELRALAERLISVLHRERNRDKLLAGLPIELSEAMDKLLSSIPPPS